LFQHFSNQKKKVYQSMQTRSDAKKHTRSETKRKPSSSVKKPRKPGQPIPFDTRGGKKRKNPPKNREDEEDQEAKKRKLSTALVPISASTAVSASTPTPLAEIYKMFHLQATMQLNAQKKSDEHQEALHKLEVRCKETQMRQDQQLFTLTKSHLLLCQTTGEMKKQLDYVQRTVHQVRQIQMENESCLRLPFVENSPTDFPSILDHSDNIVSTTLYKGKNGLEVSDVSGLTNDPEDLGKYFDDKWSVEGQKPPGGNEDDKDKSDKKDSHTGVDLIEFQSPPRLDHPDSPNFTDILTAVAPPLLSNPTNDPPLDDPTFQGLGHHSFQTFSDDELEESKSDENSSDKIEMRLTPHNEYGMLFKRLLQVSIDTERGVLPFKPAILNKELVLAFDIGIWEEIMRPHGVKAASVRKFLEKMKITGESKDEMEKLVTKYYPLCVHESPKRGKKNTRSSLELTKTATNNIVLLHAKAVEVWFDKYPNECGFTIPIPMYFSKKVNRSSWWNENTKMNIGPIENSGSSALFKRLKPLDLKQLQKELEACNLKGTKMVPFVSVPFGVPQEVLNVGEGAMIPWRRCFQSSFWHKLWKQKGEKERKIVEDAWGRFHIGVGFTVRKHPVKKCSDLVASILAKKEIRAPVYDAAAKKR
jgi:hypothetical protein